MAMPELLLDESSISAYGCGEAGDVGGRRRCGWSTSGGCDSRLPLIAVLETRRQLSAEVTTGNHRLLLGLVNTSGS